jgi:hypothetical protein
VIKTTLQERYEYTFGLDPRSTVFLSCSSISDCLMRFTTSASLTSVLYFRFSPTTWEVEPEPEPET